ncbi:hypothetical protein [Gordonia malaquae]|uniref:hypothetical protein n=1 Tax=Gordonia malaquae TaxID=410332 RepID=UPI00301B55FA
MTKRMNVLMCSAAAVVMATGVAGCSNSDSEPSREEMAIAACRAEVGNKLKDPESAEYRNETAIESPASSDSNLWAVTGEVNAANSYGAKAGFAPFTCDASYGYDSGEMVAVARLSK